MCSSWSRRIVGFLGCKRLKNRPSPLRGQHGRKGRVLSQLDRALAWRGERLDNPDNRPTQNPLPLNESPSGLATRVFIHQASEVLVRLPHHPLGLGDEFPGHSDVKTKVALLLAAETLRGAALGNAQYV